MLLGRLRQYGNQAYRNVPVEIMKVEMCSFLLGLCCIAVVSLSMRGQFSFWEPHTVFLCRRIIPNMTGARPVAYDDMENRLFHIIVSFPTAYRDMSLSLTMIWKPVFSIFT